MRAVPLGCFGYEISGTKFGELQCKILFWDHTLQDPTGTVVYWFNSIAV